MQQREVTDQDNTTWTCVQAYASLNGEAAERAKELSDTQDGKVAVVCTPSGGAQSVRLELDENWVDAIPDEELVQLIKEAQE